MPRSQLPFLAGAVVLGALVTLLYLNRKPRQISPPAPVVAAPADPPPAEPVAPPMPEMTETEADSPLDPLGALDGGGEGERSSDPAELISRIGRALEAGDFSTAGRIIGSSPLTPEARQRLAELAASDRLKLRHPKKATEVGELELNTRARWALLLDDAEHGRDRIFFDLLRDQGTWGVEKITLPPGAGEPVPKARLVDSLGIVDAFLQAALRQEFELAKDFVDGGQVSDAKIAGLCILFEEGDYRLRTEKPLRAVFQREDTAGFLANVTAGDGSIQAQFSIKVGRPEADGPWQVDEINLDRLLADYASRIAGGDVYYTPLVQNPQGGDTLVLYFDFDEETLTPRTQRQLGIVADLLLTDPGKKLTLSGHTDALGTEDYNKRLSADRAASVKRFLVASGVPDEQIVTVAAGQTQPRRPNVTPTGEDDPDGRRANRRTEIYLDF